MTDKFFREATVPKVTRFPRQVREHEILRVSSDLDGDKPGKAVEIARNEILKWVENKTPEKLSKEDWEHSSFEHLWSGRSCSAVRLTAGNTDFWAVRLEDPDNTVPGRIWTTEMVVSQVLQGPGNFTLRLLVGSQELTLDVEPAVPGVVRQIIKSPGLLSGSFRLTDSTVTIRSDKDAGMLIDALLDSSRKLPIVVISVPSSHTDLETPLLDAANLARFCAGLALVVILPVKFSWALTERFGKRLSVYEGAARVYLPGFTEDANPFGGHELILAEKFSPAIGASQTLKQLRWIAAIGSVRRLRLGVDVFAFASLKALSLQQRQQELQYRGATDAEQLKATRERNSTLEKQVEEAERYQEEFSNLHDEAKERAEVAETQVRSLSFRIQQLLGQLKSEDRVPDANIELPENWETFVDWCDHLAGRVILTPQARKTLRSAEVENVALAARCLLWLANGLRDLKTEAGDGTLRDYTIEAGVMNAHCGSDEFDIEWQGKKYQVDWHIKCGGNTRDPKRCLRIYYFWDDSSQQAVIAHMPAHRRTGAS